MRRRRRLGPGWWIPVFWAGVALVLSIALMFVVAPRWATPEKAPGDVAGGAEPLPSPREATFDGGSDRLASTRVVPTLDAPIVSGESLVWCASFVAAWQALSRDVAGGPVRLQGAEALCDRLNAVPFLDLPAEACWAWAGPADAAGGKAARASFTRWRPGAPVPEVPVVPGGFAALGAVEAAVTFAQGFRVSEQPLLFQDGRGRETGVHAFGLREIDANAYPHVRWQVQVFHADWSRGEGQGLFEMIVDPDRTSAPYRLVLACVEPRETLAETWAYVQGRIHEPTRRKGLDRLFEGDTFLVPEMAWRVVHRFAGLEGRERTFQAADGSSPWVALAEQEIAFRLDRGGAAVSSRSSMAMMGSPGRYEFDRPFLVAVLPRTRETPFFMMWVGSAELLVPFAR